MRNCDWFDKYRDGELSDSECAQFEEHMRGCDDCAGNAALLNNFVQSLTREDLKLPVGLPERIARRAFQKSSSWDFLVTAWVRPAPAWYAIAALLLAFSIMWALPSLRQNGTYSDYETLITGNNSMSGSMGALQLLSDDEMADWLKGGGN
jgi:hypothetical protein